MGRNISIPSGPDEIETTCEGATKKNICPDCANEGYTFRDITTYMCDGEQCDCKGGVLKFSKESIARYKKDGRKEETVCVACDEANKRPRK